MEWNGMEWNGMEWNGMEWAVFQPQQTAELSSIVYVALDLEVSIEGNTQTNNAGCL